MNRKTEVYQCRVCGGRVKVLRRGLSGLSCCGEPLISLADVGEAVGSPRRPLLDLVEVRVAGKSYWQFPTAGAKAGDAEARRINYL